MTIYIDKINKKFQANNFSIIIPCSTIKETESECKYEDDIDYYDDEQQVAMDILLGFPKKLFQYTHSQELLQEIGRADDEI